MQTASTTALALILATTALPGLAQNASTLDRLDAEIPYDAPDVVVPLDQWRAQSLYQGGGFSADDFIDEMDILDPAGEEIGEVEDVVVGIDGQILSVIAEVGGLWGIGDTTVSIPWDTIELAPEGNRIVVPVTEDTVDDYRAFTDLYVPAEAVESEIVRTEVEDTLLGPRAWRVTELIGTLARIREGEGMVGYGYVSDLILKGGEVAAVIVQSEGAYGSNGRFAYPYGEQLTGYRWNPGTPYYDLPYTAEEVGAAVPFDYGQL